MTGAIMVGAGLLVAAVLVALVARIDRQPQADYEVLAAAQNASVAL